MELTLVNTTIKKLGFGSRMGQDGQKKTTALVTLEIDATEVSLDELREMQDAGGYLKVALASQQVRLDEAKRPSQANGGLL